MSSSRPVHSVVFVFTILFATSLISGQCLPGGAAAPKPQNTQTAKSTEPQFYDEPQFTVAGVADASNLGGHGSDVMVRTDESLAKETLTLSRSATAAGARNSLPELEAAAKAKPGDYGAGSALAAAYFDAGRYDDARTTIQSLLTQASLSTKNQAVLHHMLAGVEEKRRNPLDAVREYQRAAELDPSEANLFDWGTELLVHRAPDPAAQVFVKGNRLFPHSARMLIGLGVTWHVRGALDRAVACVCQASDLNANDPAPYLFLGRMLNAETAKSKPYFEHMERFAAVQPSNALAHYYYASAQLKRRNSPGDSAYAHQIETGLRRAVQLDPQLAKAYLQLGIFYAEQGEHAKAVPEYRKAIEIDPNLEEAHYRLSQAYRRTGQDAEARSELDIHRKLAAKSAEKFAQERHDIQEFVVSLRDHPTPPQR